MLKSFNISLSIIWYVIPLTYLQLICFLNSSPCETYIPIYSFIHFLQNSKLRMSVLLNSIINFKISLSGSSFLLGIVQFELFPLKSSLRRMWADHFIESNEHSSFHSKVQSCFSFINQFLKAISLPLEYYLRSQLQSCFHFHYPPQTTFYLINSVRRYSNQYRLPN